MPKTWPDSKTVAVKVLDGIPTLAKDYDYIHRGLRWYKRTGEPIGEGAVLAIDSFGICTVTTLGDAVQRVHGDDYFVLAYEGRYVMLEAMLEE